MTTALTGAEKAAVLLVLLGEEVSTEVLRHFDEPEIEAVGRAMARLDQIPPGLAERVLGEYEQRVASHQETDAAGERVARRMLSRSLSPERATQVMDRVFNQTPAERAEARGVSAFETLSQAKPADLGRTLELEHPQTAALTLLNLPHGTAAAALAAMSEESQATVTSRLAKLSKVASGVSHEVSEALLARFETMKSQGLEEADGVGAAAEILKCMERGRSRSILVRLESIDAEIAEQLRSRVYTFEMLAGVNDRGVQELLKGVDAKLLSLAFKAAPADVAEKFFKNMSTRAAELVRDEMEVSGPAKVKDVEAAQKEILDRALKLEDEGSLTFEVPGGDGVGV